MRSRPVDLTTDQIAAALTMIADLPLTKAEKADAVRKRLKRNWIRPK